MDINEEFDRLQTEYLNTRSDKALYELYKLIRGYMAGFIKAYARKTGCYLSDLEGKIEDSTYFIIEQYLRKPDWKVNRFTAYYGNAIAKIVHGEKQKQYDELKKSITKVEVNENNLAFFETDVDKEMQTIKDLEKPPCNDARVEDLRHRWKQGELFDESKDL